MEDNFTIQQLLSREEVETLEDGGVSAPSRGGKMGVRRKRSAGALRSCWTEEISNISPGQREFGHFNSWTGPNLAPLGELVRRLQHLHQEGVDRRVADQFKEEQVLQALQTNGAQCREPEEELRKPARQREGSSTSLGMDRPLASLDEKKNVH
ncbi:hypothetical protein F7725_025404 [Dissostichus mawsoni]|uniref:Uncharacterized protein n=1 Tax=Dissostichus mawsoni TaxID=36200 RepID=A0A7J5XB20_DISMA|nr:hypothetical protein F7725_025404 [Dissostichus mawsoni]